MRFGMGLLNIQGQVQGIAIGLLLILSILLPSIVRQVSWRKARSNRQSMLYALGVAAVFVLFFGFLLLVARGSDRRRLERF